MPDEDIHTGLKGMERHPGRALTNVLTRGVPFHELDAIQMLWHGNYVKLLEEGREAFGEQYGLSYRSIFEHGYTVPVVDLHIRYLQSARMGDRLVIETTCVPVRSAKLAFNYIIRRESDRAVLATADTVQLFVTRDGTFDPSTPEFVSAWRAQWRI